MLYNLEQILGHFQSTSNVHLSSTILLVKAQISIYLRAPCNICMDICATNQWNITNLLLRNSITESTTSFISLVYRLRSSSLPPTFVVALNNSESFLSSKSGTPDAYQRHNKANDPTGYHLVTYSWQWHMQFVK